MDSSHPMVESALKKFQHWRDTRKRRSPVPEDLWDEAVGLTNHYPIHKVSAVLRVNYMTLKKRSSQKSSSPNTNIERSPKKGTGKNPASAYTGAEKVCICHAELKSGDICPKCSRGKVYDNDPKTIVRVSGGAPVSAKVYELQKLRCNTCGSIFTAEAPEAIGKDKYDSKSKAMIGLLHYGTGLPFNRLDRLQSSIGIPLPSSTQWDIALSGAEPLFPIMEELLDEAAQGSLIHNDDTTAKILDLMGKRRSDQPPDQKKSKRRGIFTTGIVSKRGKRKIVLFCTGSHHAGENLDFLLKRRKEALEPPIQMCDGHAYNTPKGVSVFLSNCLAHSRRKFVESYSHFPQLCKHVIIEMAKVYKNDKAARDT